MSRFNDTGDPEYQDTNCGLGMVPDKEERMSKGETCTECDGTGWNIEIVPGARKHIKCQSCNKPTPTVDADSRLIYLALHCLTPYPHYREARDRGHLALSRIRTRLEEAATWQDRASRLPNLSSHIIGELQDKLKSCEALAELGEKIIHESGCNLPDTLLVDFVRVAVAKHFKHQEKP